MQNHLKNELHTIISGKNKIGFGTIIQTIACYLSNGKKTSSTTENEKHFKNKRIE